MRGVLLCFDLTDWNSFNYTKRLYKEVMECCILAYPAMVLVGCKSDLEDKRCITFEEAAVLRELV